MHLQNNWHKLMFLSYCTFVKCCDTSILPARSWKHAPLQQTNGFLLNIEESGHAVFRSKISAQNLTKSVETMKQNREERSIRNFEDFYCRLRDTLVWSYSKNTETGKRKCLTKYRHSARLAAASIQTPTCRESFRKAFVGYTKSGSDK